MSNVTPGPWRVGTYSNAIYNVGNTRLIAQDGYTNNAAEYETNARLIAQAPALLETLEKAVAEIARLIPASSPPVAAWLALVEQMMRTAIRAAVAGGDEDA